MGRTIGQAKVGSEGTFAGFSSARGGRGHWEDPAGIHGRAPQLALWGQGEG